MNFKLFLEQNLRTFGSPGDQFPEPPPFWMPKYMDLYPSGALRDTQSRVAQSFPKQSPMLFNQVGRIVANYVSNWSMNPKNVESRVLRLLSDKNPDTDMSRFLTYQKELIEKLKTFRFQYPHPVRIPSEQGLLNWLKTVPRDQYT